MAQALRFGKYVVTEVLGQGAMGIVYKARAPDGKFVAIKAIKNIGYGEAVRERFFREIQICKDLLHPNIVIPFEFQKMPVPFIVFEYISGKSLAEILNKGMHFDLLTAAHLIEQIGHGLKYVHDVGIVHGDLNPQNIMITRDHRKRLLVKIVDFGIAKIETTMVKIGNLFRVQDPDGGEHTRGAYGTPGYISPELFHAPSFDIKSDLFSFGIIAHEMITGETPFPGKSESRTLNPPEIAPICVPFISIFDRVLAEDPEDRYPAATDFSGVLAPLLLSQEFHHALEKFKLERAPNLSLSDQSLEFDTRDLREWEEKTDPYFTPTQTLPGLEPEDEPS